MTRPPISRDDGRAALARSLRELRVQRWPGRTVPQRTLAEAFGRGKPVSLSLISSWENEKNPTVPPVARLRDYATFFSTERSIADGRGRLLADDELDSAEQTARDELYEKLLALRAGTTDLPVAEAASGLRFNWRYPRGSVIRVVCGKLDLGEGECDAHPYMRSDHINHTDLLTFADVDALVELFGHLRMVNPESDVRFVRADRLTQADELASHLVLLGGIGLNSVTGPLAGETELPIAQVSHPDRDFGGEIFEVRTGDESVRYVPQMAGAALYEDVGLLARMPNPNNSATTLTMCNGVFARGVYGAVRVLTDDKLRQQNETYLASRFAGADRFAVLMRVPLRFGAALTPDLQLAKTRLFEWSDSAAGGRSGPLEQVG
ncbi:MAG TPA: hypothetical protein VH373_22175 [Jatrophihabitantaceae bacterium]|jgi:hypothetical protein